MPVGLFGPARASVTGVSFGAVGAFGAAAASVMTSLCHGSRKMAKKSPNFEMTVLSNYNPKFRLLFTILNFS